MQGLRKVAFGLVVAGVSSLAPAETVTVTGPYVGTPGTTSPANGSAIGGPGGVGYAAASSLTTSFDFQNPVITGGQGGNAVGTDPAVSTRGGFGGNALRISGITTATNTINGGTYTGGQGGSATGVGNRLSGSMGGLGLDNLANTVINGGTFRGGAFGVTAGVGTFASANSFILPGNNSGVINSGGSLTINNGTFVGADGTSTGGYAGFGLFAVGGPVTINGGTFTGGTSFLTDFPALDLYVGNSQIVLNGTDFALDGSPIGYGALPVVRGTLTGRLANNGGAISTFRFAINGFDGRITLVPEPAALTALAVAGGLLGRRRRG